MMKNSINLIFLFLFSTSTANLFSQETIAGVVINSNNKSPVEYASVSIEKRTIYRDADSSGKFVLPFFASDTIIISCIGFIEKRITGEMLKENGMVELVPKVYDLPTVYTGEFKSIKIGIKEKKVSFSMSANLPERTEYATLIELPAAVKVYTLSKLAFAIRNKEQESIQCNPVRVHVYAVSSNGSPGAELLKKDIVVTEVNIAKKRLEVELSEQDITLSSPSFFVSIQWIAVNPQINFKQPQIAFTRRVGKPVSWFKAKFNNYEWYNRQTSIGSLETMMVQAEIIIRE